MERWSAAWFLAGVMLVGVILAWGFGWLLGGAEGALGRGAVYLAVHEVASVVAGGAIGWVVGPGVAVGAHLGAYNLATPVAVWLRARWLRRNRPGFLGEGWFPLFVVVWGVLLGLGVFVVRASGMAR